MKKLLYIAAILLAAVACKGRKAAEPQEEEPAAPEAVQVDSAAVAAAASRLPEEPVFDIVTNMGTIKVKLYKGTPRHRDNFTKLALSGYYDNLLFHRVINGFMIQGGDPNTRDTSLVALYGQGGPDYTIPAEFVPEYRHKKGALAAARRGDLANPMKESSGSQFYLVQNPDACVHLDGEYTVFGETVAGLNVIDKIAAVPTNRYDLPVNEVRILSVKPDEELNKSDQITPTDE